MCLEKYQEAIKDFESALRFLKNSSINSNFNYAKMKKYPKTDIDFLDGIEEKERGFMINAIKYYRKKKDHEKIVECCENLLNE